jgi:hypothetical protein
MHFLEARLCLLNSTTLKTLISVRISFSFKSSPNPITLKKPMKKFSILIFIVSLGALLLFQKEVVMPFVYKIVQSDLFLVDSKDQGGQNPISTPLTGLAYTHCNTYIKSNLDSDTSINFPEKPLNAWSLGNYQYLINAEIDITKPTTSTITKKYTCRINYKNGDNTEGSSDFANWSIEGVDGLDSL